MDESHIELLGTCGTVVNTTAHMDRALQGVDLGTTSCAHERPQALHAAGLPAGRGQEARHALVGHISGTSNQSDYLSHYVANHMFFRIALPGARRILGDHIAFCNQHVPKWNPMSVVGQHMQQAGANAGRGRGLHAQHGHPERRGLHRARHGPGRLPAAFHVLLRHLDQLLRGSRQVPRRAAHLGPRHARAPGCQGPAQLALQVPCPDLGRGPHAPAAAEQHRACHGAGHGRHLRRPAVAAHRRLRRGAAAPPSPVRASRWPRRTSCARRRT
jgi:hypothetical protein